MMKLFKNYYHPTPKRWKKIGDALLAVAAALGGGGLIAFDKLEQIFTDHELKVIICIILFTCIVGKFLTNFFTDETIKPTPDEEPKV